MKLTVYRLQYAKQFEIDSKALQLLLEKASIVIIVICLLLNYEFKYLIGIWIINNLPLALKGDEPGSVIQSSMAVIILGGWLSATILNLLVIPCVYQLVTKKKG